MTRARRGRREAGCRAVRRDGRTVGRRRSGQRTTVRTLELQDALPGQNYVPEPEP